MHLSLVCLSLIPPFMLPLNFLWSLFQQSDLTLLCTLPLSVWFCKIDSLLSCPLKKHKLTLPTFTSNFLQRHLVLFTYNPLQHPFSIYQQHCIIYKQSCHHGLYYLLLSALNLIIYSCLHFHTYIYCSNV